MNVTPRSALVVVPRRLGDVLLATPVIRSLKHAFPECAIDALVFTGTEGMLAGNPDVRRSLLIAERPTFGEHFALAARIFQHYDLALSLVPGDRSTLYAWLAGRNNSSGLVIDEPKHAWKKWLLDGWVPFDPRHTHTVVMHLRLMEALGIAPIAEIVAPRPPNPDMMHEVLLQHGITGAYATLHPFPKFNYKKWNDQAWIDTVQWLLQKNMQVVITGGAGPDERAYCEGLAHATGAVSVAGKLSLPLTAAIIGGAAVYVGPDTAPTHIAAALGVPTVALFGPTDPLKWGPWPRVWHKLANPWRRIGDQTHGNVHIVQGAALCVPCLNEGCDRHVASGADCLIELPARRVIAALEHCLS